MVGTAITGEWLELVNERSEAPTPNFARLASLSFGPPGVTAGANVGAKAGTNVEVNAASSSMSDSGLLGGFDDLPPKNDFIELPLDECLLKEEDVVVPLTDAPSCCGSPRVYSEARQAELCSRGFGDGKTVAQNTESSAFWELRTELRYMSAPVSASDSYYNFLGGGPHRNRQINRGPSAKPASSSLLPGTIRLGKYGTIRAGKVRALPREHAREVGCSLWAALSGLSLHYVCSSFHRSAGQCPPKPLLDL